MIFTFYMFFMVFVNKTETAICYGVEGIAHGGCAEPSPRAPSIGGTSRLSSDADDAPSHSPPTEARFKSVAHNKTENNQRNIPNKHITRITTNCPEQKQSK